MAVFGVIVVADPVQVGRHHRPEVGPVLDVVNAHLDSGDLRDRVGLFVGSSGPVSKQSSDIGWGAILG